MRLNDLVVKALDVGAHVFASVLAVDAVINATQGNYQMAAIEAIGSAGIEVYEYLDRREQKATSEFNERMSSYLTEASRIKDSLGYE